MRPLKITVERKWPKADYTIGIMLINGKRYFETLENTVRDLKGGEKKVYGKTAIPAGTYELDMKTKSPRFQERTWAKLFGGIVPRLKDVPGFDGVLIHPGNTAADTSGCILIGRNTAKGMLTESQKTYMLLMENYLMPAAAAGQKIIIEIR